MRDLLGGGGGSLALFVGRDCYALGDLVLVYSAVSRSHVSSGVVVRVSRRELLARSGSGGCFSVAVERLNNDDVVVPRKFVVAYGNKDWPKATWEIKLGNMLNNIKRGRSFFAHRAELEALGIIYFTSRKVFNGLKV